MTSIKSTDPCLLQQIEARCPADGVLIWHCPFCGRRHTWPLEPELISALERRGELLQSGPMPCQSGDCYAQHAVAVIGFVLGGRLVPRSSEPGATRYLRHPKPAPGRKRGRPMGKRSHPVAKMPAAAFIPCPTISPRVRLREVGSRWPDLAYIASRHPHSIAAAYKRLFGVRPRRRDERSAYSQRELTIIRDELDAAGVVLPEPSGRSCDWEKKATTTTTTAEIQPPG